MNEYLNNQAISLNQTQGTLNLSDGYSCEACNNKGLVYFVRGDEVVARLCSCREKRRAIRAINELYKGGERLTINTFEIKFSWQQSIKNKALSFLSENSDKWFFIGGQSGCGKTHICTAIAYELIERTKSVVYMRWVDRLWEIKQSIKMGSYTDEISKYKNCDVLYIDDLFKCGTGDGVSATDLKIAFEIINHRYADRTKITVISSEYTLGELSKIDEACASRIKQRAGVYTLSIERDLNKNLRRYTT